MSDPRLNGSHLSVARRDQYDAMVDELLDDRGPATSEADSLMPFAADLGDTRVDQGFYLLLAELAARD